MGLIKRVPNLLGALFVFVLIIGGFSPIVVAEWRFVFSSDWHRMLTVPRVVWAVACLPGIFWIVLARRKPDSALASPPITIPALVFSIVFIGYLVWLCVVFAVPMTAALITQTSYVAARTVASIEDIRQFQDGKCVNEVRFTEQKTWYGLCGFPSSLVAELRRGDRVLLNGKGTWMGFWVEDIRIVHQ